MASRHPEGFKFLCAAGKVVGGGVAFAVALAAAFPGARSWFEGVFAHLLSSWWAIAVVVVCVAGYTGALAICGLPRKKKPMRISDEALRQASLRPGSSFKQEHSGSGDNRMEFH